MAERKERRTMARVALSGTQIVRTHDGLEAHLLDLSLQGARVAHVGILRPGARCLVHLPAALGGLRLTAQVLWCTIRGAEWRPDGGRHLRYHSGLWFTTLTDPQQTVLAGILQQVRAEERLLPESYARSASPVPDSYGMGPCPSRGAPHARPPRPGARVRTGGDK